MPPKKKLEPPVHVLQTPAKNKEVAPQEPVPSIHEIPSTRWTATKPKSVRPQRAHNEASDAGSLMSPTLNTRSPQLYPLEENE